MRTTEPARLAMMITLIAASVLLAGDGVAQQIVQGVNSQDTNAMTASGNNLIFGVMAYQICTIKNFMVMGVYILAGIAFIIFAIKALFTKFEFKTFIPMIGAIFIVAFSDLFLQFVSAGQAWYCPTLMSQL